jgi:hypothetical protein
MQKSDTFEDVDARLERKRSEEGNDWSSFRKKRGMTTFTTHNPLGERHDVKKGNDIEVFSLASLRNPAKATTEAGVSIAKKPKRIAKKNPRQKLNKRQGLSRELSSDEAPEPGPLVTNQTTKTPKQMSKLRKMMSSSSLLGRGSRLSNFMSRQSTARSNRSSAKSDLGDLLEDGSRRSDSAKEVIEEEEEEDFGPKVKTANGKVVQLVQSL